MRIPSLLAAVAALAMASGCSTDSTMRVDGVTSYAGDAIAANTAMQMVDPWLYGVQDPNLKVPAEREAAAAADDSGPSGPTAP